MATTYPMNLLGKQFHFDVDGTSGQILNTTRGVTSTLTNGQLKTLSDWSLSTNMHSVSLGGLTAQTHYINLLFPEARSLTDWSWGGTPAASSTEVIIPKYSTNTTDGIDGTWTTMGTVGEAAAFSPPAVSKMLTPAHVTIAGVKGFEIQVTYNNTSASGGQVCVFNCFNLFGNYTQTGVEFWHPISDIPLDPNTFNLGDVIRSATYSPTFRIKNRNIQTANSVIISAKEGLGTMLAGTTFSSGGAYASTTTITSIAPGAVSPVITMKRTVGAGETQNINNMLRVAADVTSWT